MTNRNYQRWRYKLSWVDLCDDGWSKKERVKGWIKRYLRKQNKRKFEKEFDKE